MNTAGVLTSVLVLGGVGLTFGLLIALANKKLKVWEDPRIDDVVDILPGANCGACGYAGCRAFAEGVVEGVAAPAGCTVMSEGEREELAGYLGVAAGDANKVVARLLCAGGTDVAPRKASYHGLASCGASVAVSGGGKGCSWGCVGYGDCQVSCDFDAITMTANGLPLVDVEKCTACGDCVEACPLDLFVLMPMDHHLIVQCRNLLDGDAAEAVCSVACTACGRCVQDAAPGLIEIHQGLAVIEYDRIEDQNPEAVSRCPTNAIKWVEGSQGFAELELVGSDRA